MLENDVDDPEPSPHDRREELRKIVGARLEELSMSQAALSQALEHGGPGGDEGQTLRRWFTGKGRGPAPADVNRLARYLGLNPIELFVAMGWLDPELMQLALRSKDALVALADALTAFEATLPFVPHGGAAVANAAQAGRWDVVIAPQDRATGYTRVPHIHFADYVGLRPRFNHDPRDLRRIVLDQFSSAFRRTGALPEDDVGIVAELSERFAGFDCWLNVPVLLAERGPFEPFESGHVTSIAVIGGHWGGQDDIGALISRALGWGYVNTSFASMTLFGRTLSSDDRARQTGQLRHERNAYLVARTLDQIGRFSKHRVWAHGTPGSIVDVAKVLADSRNDQFAILLQPDEELTVLAQDRSLGRPDEVHATEAIAAYREAARILRPRIQFGTAAIRTVTVQAMHQGFEYFLNLFVDLYLSDLMVRSIAAPVPSVRDDALRGILEQAQQRSASDDR